MSIKSEIERIRGHIADSYTAVAAAGGTLPAQRTSANLAAAIRSVPKPSLSVYGVSWSGSGTALTRTDDAVGLAAPVPAVGTGAGRSPFDHIMPWAGIRRVTLDGNELVAIPKYWVKVSQNPFRVQIAAYPAAGFQVSPAHRDRGDGKGERDVVYVGRYGCDASYMSRSGQSYKVSAALAAFRTGIHALGTAYWQMDYAMQLTWWYLYLVEFANWDGQAAIGRGVSEGNTYHPTGETDTMLYHTGRAAGTDGLTSIQYRYMENLWGNYYEWRDGILFSGTAISTTNNPANFSSTYGAAGSVVRSVARSASDGKIQAWGSDAADPSFIYPTTVGTAATNVPDQCMQGTGVRGLYVGGAASFGDSCGPFCLYGSLAPTSSKTTVGSRIMKLP